VYFDTLQARSMSSVCRRSFALALLRGTKCRDAGPTHGRKLSSSGTSVNEAGSRKSEDMGKRHDR
jgi:hypothetical protein